jgi:hypothetical protein
MTPTSAEISLKCQNPTCGGPFEPEHGSFFRFHRRAESGPAVERFWLCPSCSGSYTLDFKDRGIQVIPRVVLNPFRAAPR